MVDVVTLVSGWLPVEEVCGADDDEPRVVVAPGSGSAASSDRFDRMNSATATTTIAMIASAVVGRRIAERYWWFQQPSRPDPIWVRAIACATMADSRSASSRLSFGP